ncbi:Structure-specific endonuclease subunit SLX4 [Colletotrichum fructicola]|uniref:Structure-specific endonuclease subunit SLX4 n=1 Tax=Colletotrichum fructicola (strain Nara gc5) TaxID=1213859 RepID=A0A7J6IPP0_COLFN|nr:Structure-specific endonuclease subunit [Colletotrichum fructicola]KAF4478678.1 Structure-specific endonuclease subunit SLX4 [Colletotrichum fructicola Nara gc5]KAE9575115.1 Structure-specific endonuclease subunit [Colletotrichum fructicola]KAF4422949.1 Structure-specific endonuclease subunit SLX4 [Colletotrichum fructicola]KAF4893952.1 Structure-specific endonuclease subunit SLX4 [Colletotrichum fructicola]KAF4910544.1 Structure-specific endonuclease subunit SLX4 [Colletotrichum fructicola
MGSPFGTIPHDPYSFSSSSPGLPSLDQIKSQNPSRPPLRSGSAAMAIPDNASHSFSSVSSFLRHEHSTIDLTTPSKPPTENSGMPPPPLPEEEKPVVVCLATVSKPKRKRGVKVLEKKPGQPPPKPAKAGKAAKEKEETEADQPWKKYLKDAAEKEEKKTKATKAKPAAKARTTRKKKEETVSRHFAKPKDEDQGQDQEAEAPKPPKKTKKDADGPLDLEAAMRRRRDWTPPPPADTAAGSNQQVVDLLSSTDKTSSLIASKETFDNLFKNYAHPEEEQARPSVEPPDNERQVLGKRKLIETVSINETAKTGPSERAAPKAKAPRKKPRTITELATAAYKVPEATEQQDPSALAPESNAVEAEEAKGKGKKRASKAKKPKKMPPPEPVLLSPTAALRQAANQDYVFGTSSQLAREHSPTFLRDLQSALQASNSRGKEDDPFVTPINSDAVEPEPRQKLWGVGARDEDGRVLDLEVINLADTPQGNEGTSEGPNPFGYVAADKQAPSIPNHFPSDDSFPDIDDLLGKAIVGELPSIQEEAPNLQPAAAQPAPKEPSPAPEHEAAYRAEKDISEDDIDLPPPRLPSVTGRGTRQPAAKAKPAQEPSKPKFDLYTDVQLAREISSYGFKPVKRRTAMLALLDQCWESKQRPALSSLPTNHPMISTISESQTAAKVQRAAAAVSPKRPRGRPRKNSDVAPASQEVSPKRGPGRPRKTPSIELMSSPKRPRGRPRKRSIEIPSSEPPPSAQPPPPSPKRRPGRPRKTAEPTRTTGGTISNKGKSKAAADTPDVASPAASRARKLASQNIIEIPDSASEGSLSPSPYSSPEPMFSSPPPVDASLSITEDTEMSLAASPKSQESAALFECITEAVTTAPPTTDPKEPTFHEMMLMYDPIVLEDLATWLNTGQLSRVGYDGEVSAVEVKQWCESKSVCCLWRESLRGGERKRY